MCHVRILDSAIRELARLDKPVGHRIVERINWPALHIDEIRLEPLRGEPAGLYKLRVGDYRVIYEILHEERTIVRFTLLVIVERFTGGGRILFDLKDCLTPRSGRLLPRRLRSLRPSSAVGPPRCISAS